MGADIFSSSSLKYMAGAYPTDLMMADDDEASASKFSNIANHDDGIDFQATERMTSGGNYETKIEDMVVNDIDRITEEVGLLAATQLPFPDNINMLKSPNVWIGDTGASGHCTAHGGGGINVREGTTTMTGISGDSIKSEKEMDIPCVHYDKFGNKEKKMVFKNVSYLSNANYNLCSLAKMLQDRWVMVGDEKAIVMRRLEEEIRFDIIVKTTKGALYCGYFA